MCKSAEETSNCLLLHCPAAQELWSVVFILLGVLWVMPSGMLDLLASWQARFGRGNRVIWNVTPHYLMWCLWRERNARIFEGCKKSIPDYKLSFLKALFEWMNASSLFSFATVLEMLDSCMFCA